MDLSRLNNLKFDVPSSNATITSLPSTLLDALIPGYGIFSQIIFRVLGFDIGLAVSGALVIFGITKGMQTVYYRAYSIFASYFTSTVNIEHDDQLFDQLMEWIGEQRMTKVSRDLKAVTKYMSAYEDSLEERNARDEDVLDESGIFNFEKFAANIPPRYEPNFGTDKFMYRDRQFTFSRTKREQQKGFWDRGDDQFMVISCVGRSTEPIKELLGHVKRWTLTKEKKMTSVYRPAPKEERGGDCAWDRQSCRPSRPMSTVSLDQQQKADIVTDINEYLHPASARWYAARGIPYRRGYLFHGPPGTGKTSLSFALAGIFGLDIYCLSLMEVGLTEADLNKLFTTLPRRSIVLLEDIDSAGLRRTDEPGTASASTTPDANSSDTTPAEDGLIKISKLDLLAKGSTTPLPTVGGFKSLISLSGLLNTIDGAASHEGRVLIMTTNHPEKLDPALIRPGRVDLQVHFTLATQQQTHDIFKRMYHTERDQDVHSTASKSTLPAADSKDFKAPARVSTFHEDNEFRALLATCKPKLDVVPTEELDDLAKRFAAAVPPEKFSPAEIQGFLLMRKKEPRRAVSEVGAWRDELLKGKLKRSREDKNES